MGTRIPDGRVVPSAGSPPEKPQKTDLSESDKFVKSGLPGGKNSGVAFLSKTLFAGGENRVLESNLPLLNTVAPNSLAEKAVYASTETISARELFKEIARTLGLPQDTLSVSLIAFMRFFSLSPDPSLLRTLRREILSSQKTSSPGTAIGKAVLEAETLAMVSALDKGVELNQDALKRYAGYLEPMTFAHDTDAQDSSEQGAGEENPREDLPNAEELRLIAEEQASDSDQKDDLLDLMNSLPGKDGKYWKLIPFKINIGGTELKVFLRLLKRGPICPGESEYVIADIAGPKRQWRCIFEKTGEKLRADIQVYPGLSAKALKDLEGEAERFLKGSAAGNFSGFDEVKVRNGEEMPSWMEDLCNKRLPSVNEEV